MTQIVSSISGIEIYAPSAGYAPTNSADVSAIASGYQVVSATATQLYAGTAFLTSVNETPVSASRAGNAANAGMANSAYYDGTGRLISALPDSAAVSGIASSYAESAASGKLDSSASSSFYTTANESGFVDSAYVDSAVSGKQDALTFDYDTDSAISAINGSALARGGVTGDYLTAVIGSDRARLATGFQNDNNNRPSLFISAERDSARSTWPRMILTDWNRTTGLNHSGMLLADGFEFYQCPDSAYGEVNPSGIKRARLDPTDLQFLVDTAISSDDHKAAYGRHGLWLFPTGGSALSISISSDTSVGPFIQLNDNSGSSGKMMVSSIGYWNDKLDGSASSAFYTTANESGYVDSAYVESQVSGVIDTVSSNSASWSGGGVDSATVSAIASAYAESAASGKQRSGNYISAVGFKQSISKTTSTASQYIMFGGPPENTTSNAKAGIWLSGEFGTAYYKDNELNLNRNNMKIAFNIGGAGPKISSMATGVLHSYMYLFASGNNSGTYSDTGIEFKDSGNNTVALYDSATYGNITSVYDTVSANSATWGQGGVDSATVSAIASSYAESAVSGKQDSSAMTAYVDKSAYDELYSSYTGLSALVSQYSGWFNELSSISAKVDSSAIGVI